MRVGDRAFFYHSNAKPPGIVGVVEVGDSGGWWGVEAWPLGLRWLGGRAAGLERCWQRRWVPGGVLGGMHGQHFRQAALSLLACHAPGHPLTCTHIPRPATPSCPARPPAGLPARPQIVREAYPDHTQWDPASKYYDPSTSEEKPKWFMVDCKLVGGGRVGMS